MIIVANRLPVRFERTDNVLHVHESEGGLATALASLDSKYIKEWVGWPGVYVENTAHKQEIAEVMDKSYHSVFLSKREVDLYYNGFSNETLWPLSHYFMEFTNYNQEQWEAYKQVNEKFCDKVLEVAKDGDIIWVHDYHLMLLPGLLREKLRNNPIGFFLHIPFASFELFRTLPWRKELLNGVLGAHLVGFHTFEYMQNFSNTVYRVLGYENRLGTVNADGRMSYMDAFPIGINFEKFNTTSASQQVLKLIEKFQKSFGNVKLILSIDRLDYTKGIVNRLKAFDHLLKAYPDLNHKVSLIMLTVPSRDNVGKYRELKIEVDELVGKINGRHSTITWTPIHYLYRSLPFEEIVALYKLADIAFVTPLRDGMNLVAKEYVASKTDANGVLILSEMAGSAIEMDGALLINPNDDNAMVQALHKAICMDTHEQQLRLRKMRHQIAVNSVEKWGESFITQLSSIFQHAKKIEDRIVNTEHIAEFCTSFSFADNRIIFLDYDGTLTGFTDNPYDARPDENLKQILQDVSRYATVVLLSGRDHHIMEEWFGELDVQLIAEHGVWHKREGIWKKEKNFSSSWKSEIMPLMQQVVENTPGSFIEEKPFSLVFHYRRCDSWQSEIRAPQLINSLKTVCQKNNLSILDGNKVVEVRVAGIDKGSAAYEWLSKEKWDFIMAIGDDRTDEDMFGVMPEQAHTIKVGIQNSIAKWRIRNSGRVRELLQHLLTYHEIKSHDADVSYKKAN